MTMVRNIGHFNVKEREEFIFYPELVERAFNEYANTSIGKKFMREFIEREMRFKRDIDVYLR